MIMIPTSTTSLILGKFLLSNDHSVYLYCPDEVNARLAGTIPNDLKIAALGLTCTVEVVKTLENLESMDFVVFPSLDVLPHDSRLNFADICRDLFR